MDDLFQDVKEFPDIDADKIYKSLIGIDEIKDQLIKESRIILNPNLLIEWSQQHYKEIIPLVKIFQARPPLFIFSGDVGTGKTSLAESFGSIVAREENIPITLYRLSLKTRGRGSVGEMTQLISSAFSQIKQESGKGTRKGIKPSYGVVFVIDEADSLAQSRELSQMHHEDRAGVNALIRGIDSLTNSDNSVLIVMCTNRLTAIDPAVRRRSATIFSFTRPNTEQRFNLLKEILNGTTLTVEEIQTLAEKTGSNGQKEYGFTYSDLTQNILPALLLRAFPDNPITFEQASSIIDKVKPTPPFSEFLMDGR